jgi:uncharacterized protein YjbI with pentapeptide repeats
MANPEHLAILRQGVEVWNEWRKNNYEIRPALQLAHLEGINLEDANLEEANFEFTHLIDVNLEYAHLEGANFKGASLEGANFAYAYLQDARFEDAHLNGTHLEAASLEYAYFESASLEDAHLNGAHLEGANFNGANLEGARLYGAHLDDTLFIGTLLRHTNFTQAWLNSTLFSSVNLSEVIGLEEIFHKSPSSIDIYTLQISKGNIPEKFLRGCGLSDWDIEFAKLYNPDLSNQDLDETLYRMHDIRAHQSIQISPLFISYSHVDSRFVDQIEERLNDMGIRFWRDVHQATAGRLEKQINKAIRSNPTVLVILSENSLNSYWVEHEVRTALDLEKELDRDVLCPIALDDSWKTARWPARIMEQLMEYNILDFSGWQDDKEFNRQFKKLIDGLDIFYK